MARYEKDFVAAGEAELEAGDMIRALVPAGIVDSTARCRAMALLLSGREGWKGAARCLGGAFADAETGMWLTRGKE